MTTVSPGTEKKLRDAMQRLLDGKPQRTDGRLTKSNLHVEAGVSRATMNRALAVVAEWDVAVRSGTKPRDAKIAELEETVAKLRQTTAKLRTHNAELERLNKAAATVIAELHTQLLASRNEVPTGTVAVLKGRQSRRYVCR